MADQNVTIAPGPAVLISPALGTGATLYNHDSANAVWIGGSDVTPGYGARVGAYGSVQWTETGPCYAVLDTGVTSPVNLTISTNTANPVAPVDIATATATQLLHTGIPNVLVGSAFDATNAFSTAGMDVSAYESITVTLTFLTAGGSLSYGFYDPSTGLQLGGRTFVIADTGAFSFTTPVKGPNFFMTVTNGLTHKNRMIYGSNRALPEKVMGAYSAGTVGSTQSYTSGTSVIFNGSIVTNGGPHMMRWVITGSGTGLLGFSSWDSIGASFSYLYLADSKEGHVSPGGTTITELHEIIYLPPGILKVQFLPYTTGSYQSLVSLVPTS